VKESQFLQSHNVTQKVDDFNRLRTWCPTSTHAPVPLLLPLSKPKLPPKLDPSDRVLTPTNELDDEWGFKPAEEVNLDRTLSPAGGRTTEVLSRLISTPREMKAFQAFEDSPNPQKFSSVEALHDCVKYLEEELKELNDFRKIENAVKDDHNKLALKLSNANDQIGYLEVKIEELEHTLKQKDSDVQVEKVMKEKAEAEKLKAEKSKTAAENILASIEYEYELFKEKTKKRETELIQSLDEARDESKAELMVEKVRSLEEALMKSEALVLSLQMSPKIDIMVGNDAKVTESSETSPAQLTDISQALEPKEANENLEKEVVKAAESKQKAESSNQELLDKIESLKSLHTQIEELALALKEKASKVNELEDAMTAQKAEMTTEIAGLKNGLKDLMSLREENARLKTVEKDHKRMVNEFNNKIENMRQKTEDLNAAKFAAEINAHRVREMEVSRKTEEIARVESEIEKAKKPRAKDSRAGSCLRFYGKDVVFRRSRVLINFIR
jgi:hypothetical protein